MFQNSCVGIILLQIQSWLLIRRDAKVVNKNIAQAMLLQKWVYGIGLEIR